MVVQKLEGVVCGPGSGGGEAAWQARIGYRAVGALLETRCSAALASRGKRDACLLLKGAVLHVCVIRAALKLQATSFASVCRLLAAFSQAMIRSVARTVSRVAAPTPLRTTTRRMMSSDGTQEEIVREHP